MSGSNKNVLSNEKWGVFYIRVPAFKPNANWEVVETGGIAKVKFNNGEFYLPRNGAGYLKLRKKVDLVVFKESGYPVKVGEDYTCRVILLGDFGVRMINTDPEVDGIEEPSPENLENPEVPGEVKWVVVENVYGDPQYMNVITEDFVIDLDDGKVAIGPNRLGFL